mmetsp:Transcript_86348/g.270171  ORF Transcript_86348/g.270171 Transcript_86348/m.270171 type:complete len:269 (-) Transcript_86348:988-1794(-)
MARVLLSGAGSYRTNIAWSMRGSAWGRSTKWAGRAGATGGAPPPPPPGAPPRRVEEGVRRGRIPEDEKPPSTVRPPPLRACRHLRLLQDAFANRGGCRRQERYLGPVRGQATHENGPGSSPCGRVGATCTPLRRPLARVRRGRHGVGRGRRAVLATALHGVGLHKHAHPRGVLVVAAPLEHPADPAKASLQLGSARPLGPVPLSPSLLALSRHPLAQSTMRVRRPGQGKLLFGRRRALRRGARAHLRHALSSGDREEVRLLQEEGLPQ